MADDEIAEAEEVSASAADKDEPRRIEVKKEGPPQTAAQLAIRIALGTSGLLLVIGFFLPWLNLGPELGSLSGFEIITSDNRAVLHAAGDHRWILLLIPVLGLALTAIGYLGFRWSGIVGAVVGLLVIGYGAVTVVMLFFRTTAIGIWLILIGAFIAVGVGVFSVIRARAEREAKPSDAIPTEAE